MKRIRLLKNDRRRKLNQPYRDVGKLWWCMYWNFSLWFIYLFIRESRKRTFQFLLRHTYIAERFLGNKMNLQRVFSTITTRIMKAGGWMTRKHRTYILVCRVNVWMRRDKNQYQLMLQRKWAIAIHFLYFRFRSVNFTDRWRWWKW